MAVASRGPSPSYLLPLGSAVEEPVPDDRYHAIYFAMLLAGVGFLLPYNSFITDVDYLHHKYPGGSPRPRHRRRLAATLPNPLREPVLFSCRSLRDSGQPRPLPGCQPLWGGARKQRLAGVGAERGLPLSACAGPPAGTSIVFDMSLTYILVALVAVLLNNALVERLSLHTRITAGTLPAHLACHSPPQVPGASVSPCVGWAHLLGTLQGSVSENRVKAFVHPHILSWGPVCSSCPLPLHDDIQFQGPAQMVPPPGSLPGTSKVSPALPVLRRKADREGISDRALQEGWDEGSPRPTAHCPPLWPPPRLPLGLGPPPLYQHL